MGYRTPADYEASLRLDLIADALRRTIMDSAMVSDADIRSHYAREYERRELAALLVDPGALEKKVNIDAKKARAYYAAHKERYRSPLRLKLAAVVIDPAKLAREIEVGEDEIRAAYKERRDQFSVPETRRAAHIFVSLDANAGAAAVKKARAKIEKALKMLKSGRPFAVVAKALSEDAATAARGGDLGFFKQGTLDPKLDRTVFGMKKGQLSDIIRTRNGFHILKLTDVRPPRLRSLAEVRGQLLEKLRRRKAEDEAYKLSQDLDDALGREDSLKAAASSLNLKVREIGPISREEALADPLLGRDVEFRNRVFTLEPGAPVEVMELGDGRYAAVEVEARIQPQVLPYAKVVQRVIKDARVEAARERARKLAESLLREAKNAGMPAMAKAHGLPLYLSKPVRRRGAGDDKAAWLTPAVLKAAFSTPAGAVVPEVIATPQGFVVVKVRRVIKAEESGFSKHEKDIRSELERSRGGIRFARWMAAVRARHEIQIHPDVLARF
jgi:Parvulin-like peptidyl-prolyl isomerase